MSAHEDVEKEKPLDPATERVRRKMVRLLGVSIGIMMVGLMAVLGAIVYKLTYRQTEPQAADSRSPRSGIPVEPGLEGRIDLPEAARVLSADLDGGNILLRVKRAEEGEMLLIYSVGEDRIIARVAID